MADYDPFAATQIRAIAGLVAFVLIATAARAWPKVAAAARDRRAVANMVVGAIFGPFLGVSLSLLAVQATETGIAATIMALVPVFIIPPAILVRKERVTPRAIAGAGAAVAGVAILFL
jgi:drug/metabolite transporter (DMT)-like permease